MHEAADVFRVDDADDVFRAELGVVDGDAGVLLFDDAGGCEFHGHVRGKAEDAATRRHDFADGDVVEVNGAVNDLFLEGGKQAAFAGFGGDELEFVGGVELATLCAERGAEEP